MAERAARLRSARLRSARLRSERGSVLMLFPAGVLIVLVLGSIAVDFGVAFYAERELAAMAAGAANDAVGFAVDEARFRDDGTLVLDSARAAEAVTASIASRDVPFAVDAVTVELADPRTVAVTISGRARYVFATAIPGVPHEAHVSATATATLRDR